MITVAEAWESLEADRDLLRCYGARLMSDDCSCPGCQEEWPELLAIENRARALVGEAPTDGKNIRGK